MSARTRALRIGSPTVRLGLFRSGVVASHDDLHSRTRTVKTLLTGALIGTIVLAGSANVAYAHTDDLPGSALSQFRDNLAAASDIAAFDALTEEQRADLARYLLGETDPLSQLSDSDPHVGDFELRVGGPASASITPLAAGATRTVSAWQSFLFAGITISKTTVRETYLYSGANATRIASYSCVVDANYDPFAEVSVARDGSWISSGKAIAQCKVTVKRGAPSPWGQVTWSTASNVQYVSGNGYGKVVSHGWR